MSANEVIHEQADHEYDAKCDTLFNGKFPNISFDAKLRSIAAAAERAARANAATMGVTA